MKKRREYSAEYKAKLVIEILREEKSLSEIASREGINSNQLGNWKREFVEKASTIFQKNAEAEELGEKLKEAKEKEREYQAKVGEQAIEIDWLKKKSEEVLGGKWDSRSRDNKKR